MVNLALYRHYEVLKRGANSVRLSLAILATLAGTIILFFRLGLYSKGTVVAINSNLITCLTFSVLIISVISVVAGFFVSDNEAKKADNIVSDYFLNAAQNTSTQNTNADQALISSLNATTDQLEKLSTLCNGLNLLAAVGVVLNYITVAWPFLSLSDDSTGKIYLIVTIIILVVFIYFIFRWWNNKK
ncbi:hypothetical protein WKG93_05870 [Pantoea agglomerans]|uniref:hypothetical protein n=1 Tax=Enterobacter agglomerans TaxID=549 RepID=UPI0023B00D99|nr:hypothetical protein [Pantoea agglomerans]WEC71205.1 hypothetical protein LDO72_12225 [Pantoea agglomerans]